jgi:hypothetical protein
MPDPSEGAADERPLHEDRELTELIYEGVLRDRAREIVLRGEVDAASIALDELRELAHREIAEALESGDLKIELTIDHSDAILRDARRHADEGHTEYAFVFYGLYVEHLLNRAIRDRAIQLELSESETVEVMKKSLHDKTGISWRLLFGERMPEAIVADIRRLAERRNAFMHYKWKPDPTADMMHEDIQRESAEAVATAERAAEALRAYTDRLVAPPESDAFAWLTRARPADARRTPHD